MSLKRHFAATEHEVSRCVEEAQALKRLRITDSLQDVHEGAVSHPDQQCGVLPRLAAQSVEQKEQYVTMNALLKQLHMERMQRMQPAVAHGPNSAPH